MPMRVVEVVELHLLIEAAARRELVNHHVLRGRQHFVDRFEVFSVPRESVVIVYWADWVRVNLRKEVVQTF